MNLFSMPRHRRNDYHGAAFRANFFLWCALRGHALPGNDPQTGQKRSRYGWSGTACAEESRAAYLAMARVALARARAIRHSWGFTL